MTEYFKALKMEEIEDLLDRSRLGYLGTIGDGQPYVTPIAFAYKDGKIFFNTLEDTKKVFNVHYNPKVCFLVVEMTPQLVGTRQITVFGEAERLKDEEAIAQARRIQLEKYAAEREGKSPPPNIVHYRIEAKRIVGKLIGG